MDHGTMNMATTTLASAATAVMSMPAATSSKAAMSGMGGSGCKISMLWNWNTVGACFISSEWKITSSGMFAGSCIGVFLLTVTLELLRRAVKEYDRYLIRAHLQRFNNPGAVFPSSASTDDQPKGPTSSVTPASPIPPFRPSVLQQAVRAFIHMCQFAVAYFVMLLAMYYNGYLIICIFLGSYFGAFVFQWETLYDEPTTAAREATVCCG
ncbi:Copper transport protein ctr4-like protein 1 [Colletotrichum chlorophyti]|uniref:Copper transport protein n=1 Tax=Colletotrichum chlorophyti TaxID=708187 RepID=A0A1Q8RM55_9PEZI|nr:Copper transport protein ctr4-like protein 1 [Colletotrichum chlorophyti]